MRNTLSTTRRSPGFSLIELLTVIAIIAVLAGIMFPVIVAQTAKARRNACASNMAEIAGGLRMYKLDNGVYPPVLFAFAHQHDEGTPGDVTYGLYPHWVRDATTFACPNSPALSRMEAKDAMRVAQEGNIPPRLTPILQAPDLHKGPWAVGINTPLLYPTGVAYAVGDSYDVNVLPTQAYGKPGAIWERHYQLQWLPMLDLSTTDLKNAVSSAGPSTFPFAKTPEDAVAAYARQLVFRFPDDQTVVTVCGYHREYPQNWQPGNSFPGGSMDVVLFLDGHTEMRPSAEVCRYGSINGATMWAGWQMPSK